MTEYIVELSIVIRGDDRLALEAVQAAILEKVDLLAGEFEIEAVAQPIAGWEITEQEGEA